MKLDKENAIALRSYNITPPEIDPKVKASWKQYIPFGYGNDFPDVLYDLYSESELQSAIINNQIKYTYGAGLKDYTASIFQPNIGERWEDFIKKCITDYCIYGAFAVQIVVSESGDRFLYYHTPVNQVRLGGFTEDNQIETAYLATNWKRTNNRNVVEIKMWGVEQPKKGERYLAYFKPYDPKQLVYAIPKWASCMNWIAAEIALGVYYHTFIKNNFSANLAITFPSDIDEDKKQELYQMLTDSFGGPDAAGSILLLFGENGTCPNAAPIESVNADVYNQVCDLITKKIITGNRLTSPVLAGISTSDGFASRADEAIAAYSLYKLTVIDEIREFVMFKINYLLTLNGQPRVLQLQDYDFRAEFEGNTTKNDEKEESQIDADNNANDTEEQIEDGTEQ